MQLGDTMCVMLGFGVTLRDQIHHQRGHRALDSFKCIEFTCNRDRTYFPETLPYLAPLSMFVTTGHRKNVFNKYAEVREKYKDLRWLDPKSLG
jgi:hypothetical protein